MSSKTKIVVLRMKEVIYTGIFIGLALLLLILCFIMFRPAKKEASTSSGLYIPGLYSASLTLGNEQVNVSGIFRFGSMIQSFVKLITILIAVRVNRIVPQTVIFRGAAF